ncbi:MAG: sulfatase-like hydrolase/transferase [Chloroflexi bacterium]|nr:sulfatase-like hydrolase/transferase [Chloroflexota bacterium]
MQPTNLLILMADQHNRQMMGCVGHPDIKTPNLDRLAARGTRFANAYTNSPICVPSRAAMATGRYPHTIGVWDNAAPYTGTPASFGHRLTEAGHPVTTIGKLHFRSADDDTGYPDQRIPLHCHEGLGDLRGILRAQMPPHFQHRKYLLDAGAGDSEYLRYDRAITSQTTRWLREEAPKQSEPWTLWSSWVSPHPPFIAPPEFMALYDPATITLPVGWEPRDWVDHPAMNLRRRIMCYEEPLDEATFRQAICTYYALVSFMDAQIGEVLRALDDAGLTERTRILYTNDHGDMVGKHGLWYKSVMYEDSAGVSMLLAGPDIPEGKVSQTNVTLADVFPTALQVAGVPLQPEDADLPGRSLLELAAADHVSRTAFSEFHSSMSATASFMLRDDRYKLIYYVGMPSQLFDLQADPDEAHNLAEDPAHAEALARLEAALRAICDPEAVDAQAQDSQRARVEAVGGAEAILSGGVKFTHSPPPGQFA